MHVVQKRYDESAPDVHVPSAVGIGGLVEPEMAPNLRASRFVLRFWPHMIQRQIRERQINVADSPFEFRPERAKKHV